MYMQTYNGKVNEQVIIRVL